MATATDRRQSIAARTLPVAAVASVVLLVMAAARPAMDGRPLAVDRGAAPSDAAADPTVAAVDAILAARRRANSVRAATPADDLTVLRRLWLALAGTIPSLEEIRRFEADAAPDRTARALRGLLADRRSAEALARRLASGLVGDERGTFIVFRRDRFTSWLADQLAAHRPWDAVVRDMVAARGLWTDTPAVNFITQAATGKTVDAGKLAGRAARVFLGTRLDCAQCHDHPFAAWTQRDFEGLAACFAQARLSAVGVEDDARRVLRVTRTTAMAMPTTENAAEGETAVPPSVPFGVDWLGRGGTQRENLAAWLVHADNLRFDRAIANRMWAILFGRPWHEPVDDLPAPRVPADHARSAGVDDDPLDLLAADFRRHGRDLRRLIEVIAATEAFRMASDHPLLAAGADCDRVVDAWAAFPLSRLAPEQMIGAMVATTSLRTIDKDSHLLTRTVRFLRENDFLREYGRVQDGQGRGLPATVPQTLAQMNARLTRDLVEANATTATGRIAGMAAADPARVELAFLVALTRRPTPAERDAMLPVLGQASTKGRGMEDLMWALLNGPEFCWNH